MTDYISREALENWVREEMASLDSKEDREFVIQRWRKEIPAADVAPVVHARWITCNRHEHYPSGEEYEEDYCSACGKRGSLEYDYCPHCGAIMDGGERNAVD